MNTNELAKQLDDAIELCNEALRQKPPSKGFGYPVTSTINTEASTTALTLAERISGRSSDYYNQISKTIKENGIFNSGGLPIVIGVLKVLKKAVNQGLLVSIKGEIQGDLFADFLERASWLLTEKHKDAAAVIAGSVLEGHLRQLCIQNGIELDIEVNGGLKPKKADLLNSELSKADVYSNLDQKNVTAWLDLRNKAAHGLYAEYQIEQVSLMISGIRDFVNRMKV